jgi:hypothetical protein
MSRQSGGEGLSEQDPETAFSHCRRIHWVDRHELAPLSTRPADAWCVMTERSTASLSAWSLGAADDLP